MNAKRIVESSARVFGALVAVVMAWVVLTAGPASNAQTTAANLSPDLQEIVKLAQAHMSDEVILSFIKGSGKSYTLSADDMLYLNSQGVSQPVISALIQTKSAGPATPASPVAPAPAPPPPITPAPAPATAGQSEAAGSSSRRPPSASGTRCGA